MDDAEILNAPCNAPMAEGSSIRCTLPLNHDAPEHEPHGTDFAPLHCDEDLRLFWGPLSAVDAIVEP